MSCADLLNVGNRSGGIVVSAEISVIGVKRRTVGMALAMDLSIPAFLLCHLILCFSGQASRMRQKAMSRTKPRIYRLSVEGSCYFL